VQIEAKTPQLSIFFEKKSEAKRVLFGKYKENRPLEKETQALQKITIDNQATSFKLRVSEGGNHYAQTTSCHVFLCV
jgi:hypothetical protein